MWLTGAPPITSSYRKHMQSMHCHRSRAQGLLRTVLTQNPCTVTALKWRSYMGTTATWAAAQGRPGEASGSAHRVEPEAPDNDEPEHLVIHRHVHLSSSTCGAGSATPDRPGASRLCRRSLFSSSMHAAHLTRHPRRKGRLF